jgi:small subunit ribosomal protein S18
MSKIEDQSSGKKEGEIRYLTPLNIDTNTKKKYCIDRKSVV